DQVQTLTGYNFYSNVSQSIQDVIESTLDLQNDTAPVANNQNVSSAENNPVSITLTGSDFNVNNVLSFTVVTGPTHGALSGTGATIFYTPTDNYFGPDSVVLKVNDGALDSIPGTVTINVTEVNDPPTAVADSKTLNENTTFVFPASDLTANDNAGPGESGQALTVTTVSAGASTHGSIALANGMVTYVPDSNFFGPAAFSYTVCDNGTTGGAPDSKCAAGTVNLNVVFVDSVPPVVTVPADITADATSPAGAIVTFSVSAVDQVDGPRPVTCVPPSGSTFAAGTTTVNCSS